MRMAYTLAIGSLVGAAMIAGAPRACAQFSWDGDCSTLWHDCCMQGQDYVNNWSVPGGPGGCPPVPGPTDTPSLSGTVDSQGYLIGIAGLFQSGLFLCRAQNLTIHGGDVLTSGTPLEPSVFQLLDGSIINLIDGATIDLGSFSTFDARSGVVRMFGEPAALMHIAGGATLTKTAQPESTSVIQVPIDNDGAVTVNVGTLMLSAGGTSDGLLAPASGTTMRLEGAFTDIGGEVGGDGTLWFSGGTYSITGDYHPKHTLITYGAGGAIVHFEVDAAVENLSLGNSSALGGAGDLTVDNLTWHEGSMLPGGTTIVEQTALLPSCCTKILERDMELHGVSVCQPGTDLRMSQSEIRNYGEVDFQGSFSIAQTCCSLNSGLRNYGTLTKSGGGTGTITVLVSNVGGIINVEAGTLRFDAQMASTGPINLSPGAEVVFGHGDGQSLFPQGSITGPGTLRFTGGVLDLVEGVINVPDVIVDYGLVQLQSEMSTDNLTMVQGVISGSGDVTAREHLEWYNGEMTGAGTTIVEGTMHLTGYALLNRTLELRNSGAPVQSGPGTLHVAESGLGRLQGSGTVGGNLNNRGTLSPGTPDSPIGAIHVTGDYYQPTCCSPTTQVRIELDNTAHDQLTIAGSATLGGALVVSGMPAPGQSYTIVTAQSVSGAFGPLNMPAGMTISYTPTAVILHAAPAPCPADIAPAPEGDDAVNVNDLLAVINGWGACPAPCPPHCAADISPVPGGDCAVDVNDLLEVINAWGPCP